MATRILITANIVCLMGFLGVAFLFPLHAQSQANARYDELQSHGAINASAAESFQASRGVNPAMWIATPAISGERTIANAGIALAAMNLFFIPASTVVMQKKQTKKAR
jgi:hypothetical protein